MDQPSQTCPKCLQPLVKKVLVAPEPQKNWAAILAAVIATPIVIIGGLYLVLINKPEMILNFFVAIPIIVVVLGIAAIAGTVRGLRKTWNSDDVRVEWVCGCEKKM